MIARAKLEVILGVLAPRLAGGTLQSIDPETDPAPQTSITVERIAVVSVIGTLFSRSGYLDAASGLLSYGDVSEGVAGAMADPTVRGVVLDVDSSGGEVGGLFDLVEQIRVIKNASEKPLWARSQMKAQCLRHTRSQALTIGFTSRARSRLDWRRCGPYRRERCRLRYLPKSPDVLSHHRPCCPGELLPMNDPRIVSRTCGLHLFLLREPYARNR
jgi:hypothetical protein